MDVGNYLYTETDGLGVAFPGWKSMWMECRVKYFFFFPLFFEFLGIIFEVSFEYWERNSIAASRTTCLLPLFTLSSGAGMGSCLNVQLVLGEI